MRLRIIFLGGGGEGGERGRGGRESRGREGGREERESREREGGREGGEKEGSHTHIKEFTSKMPIPSYLSPWGTSECCINF